MIIFYVDEAGNPHSHHEPLLQGETPLFCLSAVALHSSRWRELDRAILKLKQTYFSREMTAFAALRPDMRPEHYEVKGSELFRPSNARSRRCRVFAGKILNLCESLNVRLFSVIWRKDAANPAAPVSIYTHSLQVLAERFHHYCCQVGERGLIVGDARTRTLDFQVAAGHLSFIFGHPEGRTYTWLTEAPMFVDSVLSAGVQVADILGSCIYGNYYQLRCSGIAGLFAGPNPVSPREVATGASRPWVTRIPARNYKHCASHWQKLDALQFKRTDVLPPAPGRPALGFYGFRELG